MTGTRILFVDDEPKILEGLRHRLHRQRNKWHMLFVQSGPAALDVLAREPIDVIVSDMRMPEMDGATLLKKVQELHPRVVRIVLSGHAELETALRAVPVAHQFLSKPCEPGVLENVVERACNLQSLVNEDAVKRTVGRIESLPALPRVYSRLMTVLANETATGEEVAAILKQDMALCAKVLQIVNSAFFGLARSISKVEEAVTYLGFTAIKQIVLAVEVFRDSPAPAQPRLGPDALQRHSLLVAGFASTLFKGRKEKEEAFVAGLLHDIGKLVLAVKLPEHLAKVFAEMDRAPCPMSVAEKTVWGVTHAEVGAYLLGLWGLPYPMIEAVANHHEPRRVDSNEFGILAATHIADGLINDELHALAPQSERHGASMDVAYLEKLGLTDKIEGWRELAHAYVSAHGQLS